MALLLSFFVAFWLLKNSQKNNFLHSPPPPPPPFFVISCGSFIIQFSSWLLGCHSHSPLSLLLLLHSQQSPAQQRASSSSLVWFVGRRTRVYEIIINSISIHGGCGWVAIPLWKIRKAFLHLSFVVLMFCGSLGRKEE